MLDRPSMCALRVAHTQVSAHRPACLTVRRRSATVASVRAPGGRADAVAVAGRRSPRSVLAGFLQEARHGPRALVVEGEAGMGKTVLWREALSAAAGMQVLVSMPTQAESALPFAGLSDLLADVPARCTGALPEAQRLALDIALCRTAPGASGLPALAVAHGLLSTLRLLVAEGPVLIAVDDLPWLDPATASALLFALRRLDEPVSLLATRRTGGLVWEGEPDLAPELLRLGPLDLDEIDALLELRLGHAFRLPALLEVQRSSGGNPLHAVEVARAALQAGVELYPGCGLPVPPDLASLLRARLEPLPPHVTQTLVLLAASAHPTESLLADAVGDWQIAQASLAEAFDRGLVVRSGMRLRLFHPLCAAVLLDQVTPAASRAVHARLAEVVAEPVERARHLGLAQHEPDEAVAAAVEAGASFAAARGAPVEAAELAAHALRLTPEGDAGARAVRAVRTALHHEQAGTVSAARPLLIAALADLPPGPSRVPVLLRLAAAHNASGQQTEAMRTYEQAVHEAGDDPQAAAEARQVLAWELAATGHVPAAQVHARACAVLADHVTPPALAAGCRAISGLVAFMAGDGPPPLHDALPGNGYSWPFPDAVDPAWAGAMVAMWSDDATGARRHAARMRAWAQQHGDLLVESEAAAVDAFVDLRTGLWDSAAVEMRAQVARAGRMDEANGNAMALWSLALVEAHLGQVEQARTHARKGHELARAGRQRFAELQCEAVLGFLDLSAGAVASAWARLAHVPAALAQLGYGDPGFLRCTADAAEAGVAVGAIEDVALLVERFKGQAAGSGSAWGTAAAARCEGLLLAARGELLAASEVLQRAVALAEPLGQPFELARTLLVAGGVARRRKLKAEAGAALTRAQEVFEALPAPLWLAQAQRQAARLGGRASTPVTLTATERQIADLASQGRSNAEVAAALFVSVKTVEWNLSKVYRKTGLRSRAELAARWPLVQGGVNTGVTPGS